VTRIIDIADGDSFAADRQDPLRMFRATFEAAPYGVVVAAEEGTILFANAAAGAVFRCGPDELIGQPIRRLVPGSPQMLDADYWSEFWRNPESRKIGLDRPVAGARNDGGTVPLEIGFSALVGGQARYVVASIVDLTDRLALEARLAAVTSEHLAFQHLVADITARLANVEPDALHDTIVDGLRQIGEALLVDRAMLWRWRSGEATAHVTHCASLAPTDAPETFPSASIPHVIAKLEVGEPCWFARLDDLPDALDRETFRLSRIRSGAMVPLVFEQQEQDLSALVFVSTTKEQDWPAAIIERLRLLAGVLKQAFARTRTHVALQEALDEIKRLRDRLKAENVEFRREAPALRLGDVVSESIAMRRVLAQIEQVAPTQSTVLLVGETGTGKEVLAQAIHNQSPRHQRQMMRVSCAAIPTALIESELFGRERGAYTGAFSRQIGRFEAANHSTLFLDEIGELPMEVQVKLLRVLQDRVIERLGSTQPIKVDVRIIAATNRNLEEGVANKSFREDLFYRLNVFPVIVPPLRERLDDIPGLVWSFIDEFSKMFGKAIESISKDSMAELQRYPWPGNVRELRNVIERAVIISTGRQLSLPPLRPPVRMPQTAVTMADLEVEHIRNVLESSNWRVRGRGGAAERLGLKPTTLESRMARLGITRKRVP
jgi:formate hydrogenlyase transcriptional activator